MSLKTRIDPRSKNNNKLYVKDSYGNIMLEIEVVDPKGCTLEISCIDGITLSKDNGWESKSEKNTIKEKESINDGDISG